MTQAVGIMQGAIIRPASTKNVRMIFAIMIGNVLEWYDFVIYAYLTPILSTLFFPKHDPFVAMVLTFAIFASGSLARPLGGALFGHMGDRYGRRKALISSVLLMAVPALMIALLPTYDQIGKLAPCLLLVCRILQGFSAGGEKPVMTAYVGELAPPERRGFFCSFGLASQMVGVLIASLMVVYLIKTFSTEEMQAWGWRLPFLFTLFSVMFGFYLRLKLLETNIFKQKRDRNLIHKHPIIQSFKTEKRTMLKIFSYILFASAAYYSYNIFIMTYLKQTIGMAYLDTLYVSAMSSCFLIVFLPLAGLLSDHIGRRRTIFIGLIGLFLLSYPLYMLYGRAVFSEILFAQFSFGVLLSLIYGPATAMMIEQVDTSLRCTSVGFGYNLGQALFGATAPMVNMMLIKQFDNVMMPSFYLMFTAIIAFVGIAYMRDRTREVLS